MPVLFGAIKRLHPIVAGDPVIRNNHAPWCPGSGDHNFTGQMRSYTYRGDRLTATEYKNADCQAVLRPDGKCIRGKNGNMLVVFEGKKVVVLARQLRKIAFGT
jgi:hypothetical protein